MTPLEIIKETQQKLLGVLEAKNKDYASSEDFFKNFRGAEFVGVSTIRGILVRMMDKVSRISNLLERGEAVKGETIEDATEDLIGYASIADAFIKLNITKKYEK